MDREEAKAVFENILFVADAPVSVERIVAMFDGELTGEEAASILEELHGDFESRSLRLVEVAEGWRIQTRPEYAPWITRYYKMERGQKLSRASLETLSIVAYRQPITRAEIDEIRSVDSGGVLRGLIDKGLIKSMGRRKVPGRPMMYGTTNRFLEYFGLARLADMPTLDEFQLELGEEGLAARQEAIEFAPVGVEPESDDTNESNDNDEHPPDTERDGDEKPRTETEDVS